MISITCYSILSVVLSICCLLCFICSIVHVFCGFFAFIFFFKQKTAYEMRISDWSSDVCSSDLGYSIGIKELWQLPPDRVTPGKIVHSFGWPADTHTYGGSFMYHLDKDRIALGYISGLDYSDPHYQPWEAFQR